LIGGRIYRTAQAEITDQYTLAETAQQRIPSLRETISRIDKEIEIEDLARIIRGEVYDRHGERVKRLQLNPAFQKYREKKENR